MMRPGLSQAQQWRLVDSLFKQSWSLVEGSVALAIVLAICTVRTGNPVFVGVGAGVLVLLALRLKLAAAYRRQDGTYQPRQWALWFLLGAVPAGFVWGLTSFYVIHWIHDPALWMIVLMVQAGWAAGLAVRNAVSPATVLYQSAATLLPAAVAFLCSHVPFEQATSFFFVVQIAANASVARYLGNQTLALLTSEQALASANARLSGTCLKLEEANARLERLSATDGLTGIGNRRAFDTALQLEWNRAAREGTCISLIVLDVDWFKAFNDEYGHPAGDDCLRTIASTLESALRRPPDFAGRFGGEEFVALLPGIDAAGAAEAAERLRCLVMKTGLSHFRSPLSLVTISLGVATACPHAGGEPQTLIEMADRALYRAKQLGRNRMETDTDNQQQLSESPDGSRYMHHSIAGISAR